MTSNFDPENCKNSLILVSNFGSFKRKMFEMRSLNYAWNQTASSAVVHRNGSTCSAFIEFGLFAACNSADSISAFDSDANAWATAAVDHVRGRLLSLVLSSGCNSTELTFAVGNSSFLFSNFYQILTILDSRGFGVLGFWGFGVVVVGVWG